MTKKFIISFLIIFSTSIFSNVPLMSSESRTFISFNKIFVRGRMSIVDRMRKDYLSVSIQLFSNRHPIDVQEVRVNNYLIPSPSTGLYRYSSVPYSAVQGDRIKVEIKLNNSRNRFASRNSNITAIAKVGKLIRITSPNRPDTHISLGSINDLKISWTPAVKNSSIIVVEFDDLKGNPEIYRKNVSGMSTLIPKSLLKPNKRYGIYISGEIGEFSFRGNNTNNSTITLWNSTATYIYTKQRKKSISRRLRIR